MKITKHTGAPYVTCTGMTIVITPALIYARSTHYMENNNVACVVLLMHLSCFMRLHPTPRLIDVFTSDLFKDDLQFLLT